MTTLHERIKHELLSGNAYLGEDLDDAECISEEQGELHRWRHEVTYVYRDTATGELVGFVQEHGNTEACDADDTIYSYEVTSVPSVEYRLTGKIDEFTP